jgi:hypothetical protein
MSNITQFPRDRIFYFGSMDDLPDIARTPEFEMDFDKARLNPNGNKPVENKFKLKLVVDNKVEDK